MFHWITPALIEFDFNQIIPFNVHIIFVRNTWSFFVFPILLPFSENHRCSSVFNLYSLVVYPFSVPLSSICYMIFCAGIIALSKCSHSIIALNSLIALLMLPSKNLSISSPLPLLLSLSPVSSVAYSGAIGLSYLEWLLYFCIYFSVNPILLTYN